MDGRIGYLRSHYRLAGTQAAAPAVASRLDRLLREEAIRSCDEGLQSALAGDESVYVVRRVKVRTSMVLSADTTDAELGRRWGSHLAAAVMRTIARGENESGNVVRFENQADYVASFLAALLKGDAYRQWFYGAFDYVQTLETKTAIRRVLLDNVSHAPAILACVHRHGEPDSLLDVLLATLDTTTKKALWSSESEQRDDFEISRSLFTTALQFVQRLEAWSGPRQIDDELFRDYWETGPPFADWRDPRSLAESVLEVVRYFVAHGYLSSPSLTEVAELSLRLDEALKDFEWLDREWLRSSVLELFTRTDPVAPAALDLPLRVSSGRATPRQRELLAAIAAAIGHTNVVDRDELAAALRILALLVNAAPGWAEDAAAKVMIENLLAARTAVRDAPSREEFVRRMQRRDVEGALRLLSLEQRERAANACRAVVALGEPALDLLETLTNTEAKLLPHGIKSDCAALDEPALDLLETLTKTGAKRLPQVIRSECAGASLLIRTMLDARLHALIDEDQFPVTSEWPQSAMLFLAIALRLNGANAFVNGTLEPGLCLLAGIDHAPTADALHAIWREAEASDYSRFQAALLRIAEGHRLHDDVEAREFPGDFIEALDFLDDGKTGNPQLDQTIATVTCLLLRMWARWLRGFSTSRIAFLVDSFICRPGRVYAEKDVILIDIDRRPLDVVMEMAGYLADLERVPWLPGKRIKFTLKGS